MTNQHKARIAIFCDIQNVSTIQDKGNYLLDFAKIQGRINWKNLYYNSQHKNQIDAKNKLENIGFKCVDVPCPLKNSADNQLIADCMNVVARNPSLKIIILVLGDRDFAGMICVLHSLGKKVIIFAQRGSASPKLIKLVGDDNFHFVDELPQLIGEQTQHQSTSSESRIHYNEAIECLHKAVKTALSQGKRAVLGYINTLMRELFPNYQEVSSILTPDGKKFKRFGEFVDAVVKDGKLRRKNQELFLIE
jgi:uncharacterized LabA/DUF88 family protein